MVIMRSRGDSPARGGRNERRNPSQIYGNYSKVPLRQHLPDTLHQIGDIHGDLLRLPSVLYRKAEAGGYRGTRGEVQKEIRHVKDPMGCGFIKGILSPAKSPYLFLSDTTVNSYESCSSSIYPGPGDDGGACGQALLLRRGYR